MSEYIPPSADEVTLVFVAGYTPDQANDVRLVLGIDGDTPPPPLAANPSFMILLAM